jgi:hypothetical protein
MASKLAVAAIAAGAAGAGLVIRLMRRRATAPPPPTTRKSEGTDASPSSATGAPARSEPTRDELYAEAKRRGIRGRSKMTKAQLQAALEKGA